MTRPIGGRLNAGLDAPAERSKDFTGTALRLLRRLTPQRLPTAVVLLLGIVGIGIGVVGPLILGHATDLLFSGVIGRQLPAGITKEQAIEAARARGDQTFADLLSGMNVVPGRGVDFDAVGRTLLLALALYLVAALMLWVQARLLNVIIQRTMVALRSDVEDKVHRLPLSYFDSRQRGEVLSRVTNDVDNIQSSLSMTISQLLTSILTVVAVLVMMVILSPLLALITVLTVPLSLWATRTIARRSRDQFIAQWRNVGRLNAHVEETYSGFTVVKTFGHRALAEDRFRELNGDVYRAGFGAQFLSGLVSPATTFVGNLSYVAVAVVGGLQVATGQITLGSIQAFIQYVRQFNQPLTQVAAMYNTLQSGIASAERVFDLLDTEEQTPDPPDSNTGRRGPGRVEFERVDFAYRPGTPIIEDLSLVAEPGSTVAIVGPTGAGKTTLVNLLMRFYEVDSGRILIDGVDITAMSRHALRSSIGMVLQDTWLFGGTIYDNIAYGRPDADEQQVVEAARAAHVDRFVATLPDGYQTRITDDGGNISAGEKQLITIARAILAQPSLLILDEATSSVDTRTELLIQQATAELRGDRTSFIIAHRLSTIRDADVILVMEAGRIVERGTHDELIARHGEYWSMTQA
ncbi:multidrug ABC transporter ATP-binding protein [Mycobacterium antarcticum]|uniref:ABC transporter ATP-binding protein n=1 Tax=unclassified Mycolicibacterium TaxID=2636767 RepID=UPI0023844964|nr:MULTISPECIES: ABC transporter ATP-binding protein [unclassified Mycolicibacterium]BDX30877.1 multidrug ABC transporter ATP-binding protein [Mycolicibacterium sp. TUM20985]GLP74241.1 multidrug ABC transporter ATP-binding protein [Mycolicibacterium sp. TUM20983]GLP80037.1 multidrug ABC transporter ATP-binding protein [Mycolicibacterium sp. TUM20984]